MQERACCLHVGSPCCILMAVSIGCVARLSLLACDNGQLAKHFVLFSHSNALIFMAWAERDSLSSCHVQLKQRFELQVEDEIVSAAHNC